MNIQNAINFKKKMKEIGPQPLNQVPLMNSKREMNFINNKNMIKGAVNNSIKNKEDNKVDDNNSIESLISSFNKLGKKERRLEENKKKMTNRIRVYLEKYKDLD